MSQMRPKSGWHRKMHQTLRELGYTLDGAAGSGHFRYTHPRHPHMLLASSPSDVRAEHNFMAELRRRHPDAPMFKRRKSSRPRRTVRTADEKSRLVAELRAAPEVVEPEPVWTPDFSCCGECKRLWLSDLNPAGRNCPVCRGPIVVGRLQRYDTPPIAKTG